MEYENNSIDPTSLESWVINKCDQWRNHYEGNYKEKFDEYYRLWRGQWAAEDTMRQSERSRIISPALQQAVESAVAEVEEATFGRGKWFDIQDDMMDQDNPRHLLKSERTSKKTLNSLRHVKQLQNVF
jgi:hypothetical protein